MADGFRLRVCHRKTGRLRYLSHLELMRACERAARRARVPYAVSQGFTPRMRIAFGPALPVGTAGEREYFDLIVTRYIPADEVCASLTAVTAEDLAPLCCSYVPGREPSLAAALTIATYDLDVKGGIPPEELRHALDVVMRAGTLTTEHKGKTKVFDLTEALPKEPEVRSSGEHATVRLTVKMGEQGSLRPDVLVRTALGRDVPAVVTRTDLFIDDKGVWRRPL